MLLLCSDQLALVLIVLAVTLVLALIASRWMPGKPVASVGVETGSEWRLTFVPKPGRKHRLCLRFDIRFQGGEDEYGLVVEYTCMASGVILVRERAGIGNVQPPVRDRSIGSMSMSSFSSTLGMCRHRATIVLTGVGPFDEHTEVTAGGTVLLSEGARLEKCEVFFA